jgi:Tfp pilus assembly protein PilN
MINLLPPTAEKSWVREQRLRAGVTFCFMAALVSLAVLVASLPTGELLARHGESLANDESLAEEVRMRAADVEKDLKTTRALIEHLSQPLTPKQYSVLIELMDALAATEATLTHFNFGDKKELELNGVAASRASLSAFRARLESHESVKAVESPLSNLVKDMDVPFSMTVTFK